MKDPPAFSCPDLEGVGQMANGNKKQDRTTSAVPANIRGRPHPRIKHGAGSNPLPEGEGICQIPSYISGWVALPNRPATRIRDRRWWCSINAGASFANERLLGAESPVCSQWPEKEKGPPAPVVPSNALGGEMVGAARFELATPCTPCRCPTWLGHAPTLLVL